MAYGSQSGAIMCVEWSMLMEQDTAEGRQYSTDMFQCSASTTTHSLM